MKPDRVPAVSSRKHAKGSLRALSSSCRRPSERVIEYLLAECDHPEIEAGSRLPSMRALAAHLEVSLPTVHTAMRKLASDGRVETRGASGTYLIARPTHRPPRRCLRFAVSIPLTKDTAGGLWAYQIGSGIFHCASQGKTLISLLPLARQAEGTDAARENLLAARAEVDGLILFPYSIQPTSDRDEVIAAFEREGKPVVHVCQPNERAVVNFVAPDQFEPCRRLAEVWQATARQRVLFIACPPLKESPTSRLCLSGLVGGVGAKLGDTISVRVVEAGQMTQDGGRRAMESFLAGTKERPDAIFCANGQLALGVVSVLRERNVSIPQEVSVVAAMGLDLPVAQNTITHWDHPLEQLGAELVAMLSRRIALGGGVLPGQLIPPRFIGGATTRPEENSLLNQTSPEV